MMEYPYAVSVCRWLLQTLLDKSQRTRVELFNHEGMKYVKPIKMSGNSENNVLSFINGQNAFICISNSANANFQTSKVRKLDVKYINEDREYPDLRDSLPTKRSYAPFTEKENSKMRERQKIRHETFQRNEGRKIREYKPEAKKHCNCSKDLDKPPSSLNAVSSTAEESEVVKSEAFLVDSKSSCSRKRSSSRSMSRSSDYKQYRKNDYKYDSRSSRRSRSSSYYSNDSLRSSSSKRVKEETEHLI